MVVRVVGLCFDIFILCGFLNGCCLGKFYFCFFPKVNGFLSFSFILIQSLVCW